MPRYCTRYLSIFLCCFLVFVTAACNRGKQASSPTGSIAFNLAWEHAPQTVMHAAKQVASPDVCMDYGISTVEATVSTATNSVISAGSWSCSAHTGVLPGVPAGSNLLLQIAGADAVGTILWRGQKSQITIADKQVYSTGTITMAYVGNDATPPTVTAVSPAVNSVNVPVTSAITVTFSEAISAITVTAGSFIVTQSSTSVAGSVVYDVDSRKATFQPFSNLAYTTTYAARITTAIKDLAQNTLASAYQWAFSTESPPATIPNAPAIIATAGINQATIAWTAVAGATSYNLYWATASGQGKSGTKITGITSPYTQSGLTSGTTYYYVVTAVNTIGESTISNEAAAAIPVSAPTNVSAAAGNGSATVTWSPVPNATSYNLYWATTSGVTKANGNRLTGVTSPYTHTGLANGTTYYYIVTAVGANGESAESIQASAKPVSPPPAPLSLTATADNCQVIISWSTVTSATAYNIYWLTASGVTKANGTKIADATSPFTHTGLTNGTTYFYIVTAVNAGGEGAESAEVSALPFLQKRLLPDTGQTGNYTSTYGEDSDYTINPPSYTDNGDGTVTDNVTGLLWQKCTMGQSGTDCTAGLATTYNGYQAMGTYDATYNPTSQNVCSTLSLGGYADWRLPNWHELLSIVDYGENSPAINTRYFPGTQAAYDAYYWVATPVSGRTNALWFVAFESGVSSLHGESNSNYIRCVHGGEASFGFTDNGDGTVTDKQTGLIWQQDGSSGSLWLDALSACENLTLGGQTDWRLPNIKELASIVDVTRSNPAINENYFSGTPSSNAYYWSSSKAWFVTVNSSVWIVGFDGGGVCSSLYGPYQFRCVRGGQ